MYVLCMHVSVYVRVFPSTIVKFHLIYPSFSNPLFSDPSYEDYTTKFLED